MTEDFDVRLTEKHYMPDPSYKRNSWVGDYATVYQEFLRDRNGSGTLLHGNSTGSPHTAK